MKNYSVLLRVAALGLFSTFFLAGTSLAGETSLREKLVESKTFSAVYAIDDNLTMATVPDSTDPAAVENEFKELCALNGSALDHSTDPENGEAFSCPSSFTVAAAEKAEDGSRSFLVRHADRQPLEYRTPAVPSYSRLLAPPKGRLKENYSNAEIYQYAYALCKKENGNPSFVLPKKYGKYTRLTKLPPADAFGYLVSSVKKKDAWYAACEGAKKFMLEKEYAYSEKDKESLIFHPNRGLEGISFVSPDEVPSFKSKVEVSIKDEASNRPNKIDFLDEMAWEVAFTMTDFVKTLDGLNYTGLYNAEEKNCRRVTIIQELALSQDNSGKRAYVYKVCEDSSESKTSVVIPVSGVLLASVYGR